MNLPMESNYASVSNVSYHKKNNSILDSLNFTIPLHKSTFILGNNGSGKSTFIDIITQNIKAYTGNLVLKKMPGNDLGVLFDTIPFSPTLKVKELIKLFELVYDIERETSSVYIDKLDLKKLFNKQFKVLSLGEKKRVGLFAALFHNPNLLILDEPFGGIDPNSLHTISSLLFSKKRTAIISSHNWKIAAEKADFVLFLYKGKQVLEKIISPKDLLSDMYIPFSRKIVVDAMYLPQISDLVEKNTQVLEYDNSFHIFLDEDNLSQNLQKKNIPYSTTVKDLNDIYNFLITRNEAR